MGQHGLDGKEDLKQYLDRFLHYYCVNMLKLTRRTSSVEVVNDEIV